MKLYVIRHAETELNAKHAFQGVVDAPISETGQKQLDSLSKFFKEISLTHAFSSPLLRCQTTAKSALEHQNITFKTEPRLREISYGSWEMMQKKELKETKEWKEKMKSPYSFAHPGSYDGKPGESYASQKERVYQFLDELTNTLPQESVILIVAHLGVLRHINVKYNNLSEEEYYAFSPGNNMILVIKDIEKEKPQVTVETL